MRLPLFPLPLVVFPGERIPLHIFEPRYKALIQDVHKDKLTFGIPAYIDKVRAYGTEVELELIKTTYDDGKIDIVCIGQRVFKIEKFYKKLPDKLYAGGEVSFQQDNDNTTQDLQEEVLQNIANLYFELTIDKPPIFNYPLVSYQVAHKVGLSIEQEYQLLTIRSEMDRLRYILKHLKVTIPVIREMNRTKAVIQMNGHFKNFDPLDFEDFEM
ncbi:LON peptidase substrate-binding domain-containing protein [Aquimarina intermedia]|uniref:Lon N-terminal domain-containing protein n=1 Tax=Aquimarina intermedia TaxID=350814 RepID=A0A5S5BVU5_9FLAO|nr:LON peptidase substrate-binding domain-containing protein [Aquimarina intermedia]TYP70436.1 hypothetical protein BD809_11228 [Aquimarina intermedia]